MNKVSLQEIERRATELATQKKLWHYHLFTPSCSFNDQKQHAFVLENSTDNEWYVHYSDMPAMDLGKRLLRILHGEDILAGQADEAPLSESTGRILQRAKELREAGKFWHHHVFFPTCRYNRYPGKWNITFEDQESGSVLESVHTVNPKKEQKEIEREYYLQKTIT